MNKLYKRIISFALVFVMCFLVVPHDVYAKNKSGWVKTGGYKYYYNSKGKKSTGFVDVDGKTYYCAVKSHKTLPKGAVCKGWYKVEGEYYYFDRVYGDMAKDTKVDGIKVDASGKAKKTTKNVEKIKLMIRARKLVQKLTKPSDSKKAKRKKVFDYMKTVPYIGYHFIKNERSKSNWDVIFANDILDPNAHARSGGECTAMSCALAYLLHECRYETVYVVDDYAGYGDAHSWVEVDGKAFDALFARTKGNSNYYNAKYDHNGNGANLWPSNYRNIATGKDKTISY